MAPGIGTALMLAACCGTMTISNNSPPDESSTSVSSSNTDLPSNTPSINKHVFNYKDYTEPTPVSDSDDNNLIKKLLSDTLFISTVGDLSIRKSNDNDRNNNGEIVLKMTNEVENKNSDDEKELLLKIPAFNTNGFPQGSNILQINIYNNHNSVENQKSPSDNQTVDHKSELTHEDKVGQDHNDQENDPALSWWQTEIVYQIYPRSFYDEVPPYGIGDIAGITSKADYFKDLGVGIIWLSPVFESPMADFGYDVSNFTNIDPIFGDIHDFDEMIKVYHEKGIKIVMDFIPNHSSDEHEWFMKSIKREDPYTDYYIWREANGTDEQGQPIPPNNWLSVFGGSAWSWSEERQQFYLHQFLDKQPDLNFRNPLVVEEINEVIKFWLDRGIDGFRVDAIKHLYEVRDMSEDEPVSDLDIEDPQQYEYLNHTLTVSQPDTFKVLRKWREILDSYSDKVMMTESYDKIKDVMKYYGSKNQPIAHFPFNFFLITELSNRTSISGHSLKKVINLWLDNMPEGRWPNWVQGNHDNGRIASRLGEDLVDGLNMITLLLPGTPVTYYGEELGMTDTPVSYNESKDPFGCNFGPDRYEEFSRDFERSPMQWNTENNAGFTVSNVTWLPVNANYMEVNVQSQSKAPQSYLKVYKKLAALRKERTFQKQEISFPLVTDKIFSFIRTYNNDPSYLIIVNLSEEDQNVNMHNNANFDIPNEGEIVLRSSHDNRIKTKPGSVVKLCQLLLLPGEGIVIKIF